MFSTRAASVSAAYSAWVPTEEVLSKAGWSSAQTCAIYYDKNLDTSKVVPLSFRKVL